MSDDQRVPAAIRNLVARMAPNEACEFYLEIRRKKATYDDLAKDHAAIKKFLEFRLAEIFDDNGIEGLKLPDGSFFIENKFEYSSEAEDRINYADNPPENCRDVLAAMIKRVVDPRTFHKWIRELREEGGNLPEFVKEYALRSVKFRKKP